MNRQARKPDASNVDMADDAVGAWGSAEPWLVESPTVRHEWQGVPPGVRIIRDQVFKQVGGRELKLDVYLPEDAAEPLPTIVWICGGGWRQMSRFGPQHVSAWLAAFGYAIIGFEYRVSSEATFPACIEDCKAAVRWVRAHADEHPLDADRIGAWGDSAGGHLTALLACSAGAEALEQEGPNLELGSGVHAACAIYPPCDLRTMPPREESVHLLIGGKPEERPDAYALASPVTHVGPDCPPHLLIHGTADDIVPYEQSVEYADRLRAAGVECTLVKMPGIGHDGRSVYGSQEIKQIIRAFFDRHLKRGA